MNRTMRTSGHLIYEVVEHLVIEGVKVVGHEFKYFQKLLGLRNGVVLGRLVIRSFFVLRFGAGVPSHCSWI